MQGCAKKHWKMGEGIEKSEEAERGVEAPVMRPSPFKLSTFLYLTGSFISGSSRFFFLLELGQAKVVRTSKLQNLEESRLTVDRRNRRSLDHLLGVYE